MAVSFASFEIARSGLHVNERGLYVTGHNISNVNTPGYVRQQAMITTGDYHNEYNKYGMYQLGLGADIQQIRQIRHAFLDNIYRQENTSLGYWEAKSKAFQDVQAILGEPMSDGLQSIMNQFWDAWQELSKEPDSLTVRALVRQRGEALVHHINHMGSQFDRLQSDLNSETAVRIDEINGITRQIAELNVAILKAETAGDTANDYRDQRNSLVDKLTRLIDVQVMEMQDGQLSITAGGYFLVSRGVYKQLYAGEGEKGTMFYVPKLEGTDIEVTVRNGLLKGLMEARDDVAVVESRLSELINIMAREVNNLHKSGKTLGNPPSDGQDFFAVINPAYPMEMGNIMLNPNLSGGNGLNNIVASESGASGDNTVALKIANLRHKPVMQDISGSLSMDDYYRNIILDVGNRGSDAERIYENQQKLVQAADMSRQTITGVSMDEEMANMLKYKYAYDASSKIINIINEMLETVIMRTGIAGR